VIIPVPASAAGPPAPASAATTAASPEEIISWCRERLAHFKCPKTVEFTDSLPRTTTGKVLKRELRDRLASECTERQARGGPEVHS
jgi:acyl-CoA synthetase (AMP-forming)/AMP-acid ligase II